MRFTLISQDAEGKKPSWRESYYDDEILDLTSARAACEEMISNFNATLRPGEQPRKIVDVVDAAASDHRVPTHDQRVREQDARKEAEAEAAEENDEWELP